MAIGLPHLWDAMVGPLRNNINLNSFGMYTSYDSCWWWWLLYYSMCLSETGHLFLTDRESLLEKGDVPAQELVNSLQVFETTAASMDIQLHPLVISMLCSKAISWQNNLHSLPLFPCTLYNISVL